MDAAGFALYFSRADLAEGSHGGPALRHAGVYAFRRDLLLEFASWPPGRLEQAERLEQLRALERGVRIKVVPGRAPVRGRGHARAVAGAGETRAAPLRRSPEREPSGKGRHGDAEVRRGHGGRGVVPRQGDRRGLAGAAAQGARPARHAAEARSLPQRGPRHHEPVPARRGLRHRRRRRDRPGPGPLRALHQHLADPQPQRHRRPDLRHHPLEGAARRLPGPHRAGHPPRHRRDQAPHHQPGAHLAGRRGHHRDRRHGGRHRVAAVPRGDAPAAARAAAATRCSCTSRWCPTSRSRAR